MSSGGRLRGATKSPTHVTTSCYSLLLTAMVVLLFFGGGIYLGSQVSNHTVYYTEGNANNPGLPMTKNVFNRWSVHGKEVVKNLRGINNQSSIEIKSKNEEVIKDVPLETKKLRKPLKPPRKTLSESLISSLEVNSKTYMVVPGNSLDHADLLVAAYIYLDETSIHDNDMRTVFSNKKPGCDVSAAQYGVAMFVNSWQHRDRKLHVEYGGSSSGCHKLDSRSVELQALQWYHVAVYSGPSFTALFVDGELVNSVEHSNVGDEPHRVQDSNPFIVGHYDVGQYAFYGNISHVAVLHGLHPTSEGEMTSVVNRLRRVDEMASVPSLAALYTLTDFGAEGGVCIDSKGGHNGQYFAPSSGSLAGVNIALVDGTEHRGAVTEEMRMNSDRQGRVRKEKIKEGMKHAWNGYHKYAWGKDELKPISARGQDNWGGMGVTLVDSLDTLWLMGMKTEFYEAMKWVETSLTFSKAGSVSVFETTIRELGGLLAAFDLSGEQVFLTKAQELGRLLMPAFNTHTGIPFGMVNFRNGQGSGGWAGNSAILSELGTLQVEFRYLSHHTNEADFEVKAMKPLQLMNRIEAPYGLYPIKINIDNGAFAEQQVTFGALGDSFYEYLLKTWLQGGKKEQWLRDMYDRAMDGAVEKLLLASDRTGLAFLSDWNGRSNHRKMDHLVCFMPGALALGAYTDPKGLTSKRAVRDLAVAKALMFTCHEMYHRMATGIAPEYVEFPTEGDMIVGSTAPFYILRPETAESLFILNQLTGDPIYRDWAWEIWEAIDKHCKTSHGYGALPDVTRVGSGIDDRMESFFLAETMKYLYLAQDPDKPIDLMKYVFNTEAHPMKIFDDSHISIEADS